MGSELCACCRGKIIASFACSVMFPPASTLLPPPSSQFSYFASHFLLKFSKKKNSLKRLRHISMCIANFMPMRVYVCFVSCCFSVPSKNLRRWNLVGRIHTMNDCLPIKQFRLIVLWIMGSLRCCIVCLCNLIRHSVGRRPKRVPWPNDCFHKQAVVDHNRHRAHISFFVEVFAP